jgi:homoserine dehydrogenase
MQSLDVVLLGPGGVGGILLEQILESRVPHREAFNLRLRILAVVDTSAGVADGGGLEDATVREIIDWKRRSKPLGEFAGAVKSNPDEILRLLAPGSILIDCTASEVTAPLLIRALENGCKIVLANKKPLTQDFETYRRLTASPAACRWETTVAAGLPLIAALARMKAGNDPVTRIAGTYSGTMNFLMTALQAGRPFGECVREAVDRGVSEPDPREDLSGRDLARKTLILARGIGLPIDLEDVEVEGMVPSRLARVPVEEFLRQASALDPEIAERVRKAEARGNRLRYTGSVQDGLCRVGFQEAPAASPLGQLEGNDNLIEIHSRWYRESPLVLRGRGEGPYATASGILADLVELAFTQLGGGTQSAKQAI